MGATANPLAGLLGLTVGALLVSSGDAAGNAEVFDIGTSLKPFEYTVMMTLIIVGLVMFDFVLETFEHHLKHRKKRFHQRLLGKALKELMILGLISFVLFILKDQALYDQSDEVLTNTFEFVNLFLFFVGVSLVLAAVMLVMATSPIKARWDTYANANLENLLALHEETISKSWTWYTAWLPRYTLGLRQAQVIEYHLFRSVFLRLNRSLLTPAFDFSKYSGAIVDELIVVFFDVQWASWLLAVVVLFLTLPITPEEGGTAQVSAHGAILFGVALLALECVTCTYTHYAYQMVMARMGVVRGYKGVGKVLKELWVEPQHHMGQETTAIDVKGLLAAAPVNAPTLSQLTSEVSNTTKGASQAQINFKNERGSNTASGPIRRTSVSSTAGSSTHSAFSEERLQFSDIATSATVSTNANTYTISTNPNRINTITTTNSNSIDTSTSTNTTIPTAPMAEPAVTTTAAAAAVAAAAPVAVGQQPPRPTNGFTCTGCYDCDALFLPSGKVENCAMGGDPFVLMTLRPRQSVVDRLPELLKGVNIKVGSYFWFRTLFGMSTLHKCYYSAFYFSYAIGKATKSSDLYAFLWIVLTPLPLILSMLPLAKRTLPLLGQLSCLQGQIVWELVSDIEESQEIAMRAREKVLSKLQETLALKTKEINSLTKAGYYQADSWGRMTSPRSRALKNWFDEWDQNSDGQISQDELAKGLQKLGVFLSAVQLRELFRLADPDHSKSIDLAEFRAFLSDLQSLDTEPERFQRELQLRLQRSSYQKERSRPLPVDEFGLLTGIPVPAGSSFGRSRHARGRSMSSVDKSLGDDPPGTTVGRAWGAASNGGGGGEGGGGCGGGGGGGASGGGASGSSGVLGETTSGGIGGPPPLASHARRATISLVPGGTGGVSLRAFEFADVAIPEGKVEEV